MKKKMVSRFLAVTLALTMGVLAACGGGSSSGNDSSSSSGDTDAFQDAGGDNAAGDEEAAGGAAADSDEDPYHIVFAYVGNEQEDMDKVEAAINELTLRELNMTFEVLQLGFGDYQEKLNLLLSGGDELDIVPVYFTQASSYISQGQILDLNDYIYDYGQDILEQVGEDIATSASINGFLYGTPAQKESASKAGIVMRKDIVDELGIDVDGISTYADLTAAFETVSEAYPDMDMIAGINMVYQIEAADPLFDNFGVLMDDGQDPTVTNLYETDWYSSRIEIVSDWYQRGFVKVDAATTTETSQNLMKAGTLFSYMSAIKPGFEVQEKASTTYEVATAYIGRDDGSEVNNLWTSSVNFFNWGIASSCENPEKAMQFLNFAYASPEWNNLMNFGIEGEHYEFVEGSEVLIDYPEGIDDSNTAYHLNLGWELPNQFIGYVWNGQDEDVWQQYTDFNNSATKSKAFGFIYDSSGVTTELTALQNVESQYKKALETGSAAGNWEDTLQEFNDKLYSSGLQTIIDTKQEQLNAWLAAQE